MTTKTGLSVYVTRGKSGGKGRRVFHVKQTCLRLKPARRVRLMNSDMAAGWFRPCMACGWLLQGRQQHLDAVPGHDDLV